jgi:hypothetical protein
MAYMLLIHEPVGQRAERTEHEGQAAYEAMLGFAADLSARGLLRAAESLASQASGVRVAVRAGQTQVLDGPFTEAKEMIGGFFLLSCDSREAAVGIAAQCPAAKWATVEVRALAPCFQ